MQLLLQPYTCRCVTHTKKKTNKQNKTKQNKTKKQNKQNSQSKNKTNQTKTKQNKQEQTNKQTKTRLIFTLSPCVSFTYRHKMVQSCINSHFFQWNWLAYISNQISDIAMYYEPSTYLSHAVSIQTTCTVTQQALYSLRWYSDDVFWQCYDTDTW